RLSTRGGLPQGVEPERSCRRPERDPLNIVGQRANTQRLSTGSIKFGGARQLSDGSSGLLNVQSAGGFSILNHPRCRASLNTGFELRYQPCTSGQPPSLRGRKACVAGIVARSL